MSNSQPLSRHIIYIATATFLVHASSAPRLIAEQFNESARGFYRRLSLAPVEAAPQGSDAASEQAKATELAKKLQNPVANLISIPIQNNWDFGIGPENAMRYQANVQPVIPFSVSENWNVITRTIVPVIYQESPVASGDDKAGLGDISKAFSFRQKSRWVDGSWGQVQSSFTQAPQTTHWARKNLVWAPPR